MPEQHAPPPTRPHTAPLVVRTGWTLASPLYSVTPPKASAATCFFSGACCQAFSSRFFPLHPPLPSPPHTHPRHVRSPLPHGSLSAPHPLTLALAPLTPHFCSPDRCADCTRSAAPSLLLAAIPPFPAAAAAAAAAAPQLALPQARPCAAPARPAPLACTPAPPLTAAL